jgi:hypothetical protein
LAEVYGNLVIVVILVMEGVDRAVICPPAMPHRDALYDSRRATEGHWQCSEIDTQQCLKTLYEACIQPEHFDEHQASIPPKCYMYPIACWGNKDVGTQSNALHRNLLVTE